MNKETFLKMFLDELKEKLESTPIEKCGEIETDTIKEGETLIGDMPPIARRYWEVAEQYIRDQKKVKATSLRVQASALDSGSEKNFEKEIDALSNLHSLLGLKARAAFSMAWIEVHLAMDHLLPVGSTSLYIRKGNQIVSGKKEASMPFPFFFGGEKP